jgi:hypothetical protein
MAVSEVGDGDLSPGCGVLGCGGHHCLRGSSAVLTSGRASGQSHAAPSARVLPERQRLRGGSLAGVRRHGDNGRAGERISVLPFS